MSTMKLPGRPRRVPSRICRRRSVRIVCRRPIGTANRAGWLRDSGCSASVWTFFTSFAAIAPRISSLFALLDEELDGLSVAVEPFAFGGRQPARFELSLQGVCVLLGFQPFLYGLAVLGLPIVPPRTRAETDENQYDGSCEPELGALA